jgi:TRAP-type C4-dicarboxylate transport system permease small subunit
VEQRSSETAANHASTAERFISSFAKGLTVVGGISLVLMMVQMVLDVFMSNVFHAPIESNLEVVSIYYMVAVVFLPLAIVELRHEHIQVDLFVRLLPKLAQRGLYIMGNLISAVFFGILAYQTWLDAVKSFRIQEMVMGVDFIEIWPSKFILPISFAVILMAILLHAWKALRQPDFDPTPSAPTSLEEQDSAQPAQGQKHG